MTRIDQKPASQANDFLLAIFSNDSFGVTRNVRKSRDVFDVMVVEAISVKRSCPPQVDPGRGREVCFWAENGDLSAIRLRAGMQWS